jgi:hypothetical protein
VEPFVALGKAIASHDPHDPQAIAREAGLEYAAAHPYHPGDMTSMNAGAADGLGREAARALSKAEDLKREYEEAKRSHDGEAMSEINHALWELLKGIGEMNASQAEMEKVRQEILEVREAEHMEEIEIVEPREAD